MATKKTKKEMAELLVELYSEEIPWKLQEPMARNLARFLQEELAKALGLPKTEGDFGESQLYWTPRRVAVGIAAVPVRSRAWEEERRGPRVNSPQVAIDGFLNANKISLEKCHPKGGYLTFVVKHKAVSTRDLLGEVVVRVIKKMSKVLPVSMRFGAQRFRWVRPLRHIMVVFAGKGVKGILELGNEEKLSFTNETRGHPFAAPDAIVVTSMQDYEDKLRKNYVEPSYEKRFKKILKVMTKNTKYDYQKDFPEAYNLMKENACLTEFPRAFKIIFPSGFMNIPYDLISIVLKTHQRMIPCEKYQDEGYEFCIVTDKFHIKNKKYINKIIKGFERVILARLADAKFMFVRDMEIPVAEHIKNLKHITFHPRLGTMTDKNLRSKKLIPVVVEKLKNYNEKLKIKDDYDLAHRERRVDMLKADLTTETVREFPEMQGKISYYFSEEVLQDDSSSNIHQIVAVLVDAIDSLVSLWWAGEKPTGSGDPFALRRYAISIITILTKRYPHEIGHLPMKIIFEEALTNVSSDREKSILVNEKLKSFVLDELINFMIERLRVFMREKTKNSQDSIEAVLSHSLAQDCNIYFLYHYSSLLEKEIEKNESIIKIFYRLHAILHSSSSSDISSPPSPKLFDTTGEEEENLYDRTQDLSDDNWRKLGLQEKLQTLGKLKDVIDPFFERVLVMDKDENIRLNRLSLLYSIYKRFHELADFTKIHHKDKQQKHSPKQP